MIEPPNCAWHSDGTHMKYEMKYAQHLTGFAGSIAFFGLKVTGTNSWHKFAPVCAKKL